MPHSKMSSPGVLESLGPQMPGGDLVVWLAGSRGGASYLPANRLEEGQKILRQNLEAPRENSTSLFAGAFGRRFT
jgi:hypothetical protein